MLIALIDDGIDPALVGEGRIVRDLSVGEDGAITERDVSDMIITNHGTTCARIILKYAPGAEFCSLRIFHKEILRSTLAQLISSLEWCLDESVPIIHMSVGSSLLNDYYRIRPIIARLLRQRRIIVAAHSNKDRVSFPACIGGVLGVAADNRLQGCEYYASPVHAQPLICASSRHCLEALTANYETTQTSNSFAAPTITAVASNALSVAPLFSLPASQIHRRITNRTYSKHCIKPDFVEDALIINPQGVLILREHLFFNCVGEYSSICEIADCELQPLDIVCIAPQGNSESEDMDRELIENNDKYGGLLYAGIFPNIDDPALRDRFVWDESVYSEARKPQQQPLTQMQDSADVPIIRVYGGGLIPLDLVCRLRDLFVIEDYQCLCMSDYPCSYLYGIEFMPAHFPEDIAVDNACSAYCPDVVILYFADTGYEHGKRPGEFAIIAGATEPASGSGGIAEARGLFDDEAGDPPRGLRFVRGGLDNSGLSSLFEEITRYFS